MSKQQWKWFLIRDKAKFCTINTIYENPAKLLWKSFEYKIKKSTPSALRLQNVNKFKTIGFLIMTVYYHRFCMNCLSLISNCEKLIIEFGEKNLIWFFRH